MYSKNTDARNSECQRTVVVSFTLQSSNPIINTLKTKKKKYILTSLVPYKTPRNFSTTFGVLTSIRRYQLSRAA